MAANTNMFKWIMNDYFNLLYFFIVTLFLVILFLLGGLIFKIITPILFILWILKEYNYYRTLKKSNEL